MAESPIRDRDWVASRLDAGATVTAIAKDASVSRQTAHTWLSRHGLHGHPQAKPRPSAKRLRALYRQHGAVAGVAEALGVSPGTAYRWLIDAGQTLPRPGAPRRSRRDVDTAAVRRSRDRGATVDELARAFGVSAATIRRRLAVPLEAPE